MSAAVRASGRTAGVRAARRARSARGFSLIELMVVVIIIGVVAALAVPTMAAARTDRHAYDDAGQIMQLFREARTRAIARGGAVLIAMTFGAFDRGTFNMYESVSANPGTAGGANRAPVASCKTPTVWAPLATTDDGANGVLFVDGLDLNGTIEQDANIQAQLYIYDPVLGIENNQPGGFLCFTPLGRTYFSPGPVTITPNFNGALPILSPLEFRVARISGGLAVGTIRSVLLPPNGMARVFSHI